MLFLALVRKDLKCVLPVDTRPHSFLVAKTRRHENVRNEWASNGNSVSAWLFVR